MAAMVETALLEDITYKNVFWSPNVGEELAVVLAFLLLRHRVYTKYYRIPGNFRVAKFSRILRFFSNS